MKWILFAFSAVWVVALGSPDANAQASSTLARVKDKGFVECGVSPQTPGFSQPDSAGKWVGFNVDYCRSIAAAIFGDPEKFKILAVSAKDRFTVLQSGEVDVLLASATWSLLRDANLGLNFTGINYYDGQSFMVRKSLNITSAKELSGASVCVASGTTTELNVADYFRSNNLKYEPVTFATAEEAVKAYESRRCDVYSSDQSGLYGRRLLLADRNEHVILPEVISKEPLGPAVRHGDDQWFDIVKWALSAQITAEELGVTQENVDEKLKSTNPEVRRLLGVESNLGETLGLTNDWAVRIVRHVGNYGEIFERNLGAGTGLNIARGLNALWSEGGHQYSPPIR